MDREASAVALDLQSQPSVVPSNAHQRYTRVAIILHWAIAILVLINLAIGPFMEGMRPPLKPILVLLHISSGITVLVLTLARIAWRLTHVPPPLSTVTRWEAVTAKAVHLILYALMLGLPLTGWATISANPPPGVEPGAPPQRGRPPVIWGLLKLPLISPLQQIGATRSGIADQKAIHGRLVRVHALGGFLMMFLVALHVLGALKHEFFDGVGVLRRMTFARRSAQAEHRSADI